MTVPPSWLEVHNEFFIVTITQTIFQTKQLLDNHILLPFSFQNNFFFLPFQKHTVAECDVQRDDTNGRTALSLLNPNTYELTDNYSKMRPRNS